MPRSISGINIIMMMKMMTETTTCNNAFCFDDERDGRLPIPFRGTGYCINPMFSGEAKGGIEKYIHSMAPGI